MPKKIITIYMNNPADEQIRIALDDEVKVTPAKGKQEEKKVNEFRNFKNSLLTGGVVGVIRDPVYVGVVDSTKIGEYFHALQEPKKGLEIYIFPHQFSHFYVEDYIEKKDK